MSLPNFLPSSPDRYRSLLLELKELPPGVLEGCLRVLDKWDLYFLLRFTLSTCLMKRPDDPDRSWWDHPWIFDRVRDLQDDPNRVHLWAREHGKMLSVSEPVPTPSGWRSHGDLEPGDELFSADGSVCRVVAKTEVFTDGEAYEIEFTDGTKIKAGAEHLWKVERKTRKRIRGRLEQRWYRESVLLKTSEIAAYDHREDNRIAVAVNGPLDLPNSDLPIDPYVLGCWLGDGTSENGDVTCGDAELFDNIERCGYEVGHNKRKGSGAQTRRIVGLRQELRAVGILGKGNKRIPEQYLRSSIDQRLFLLQGMMDTDGTCDKRGTAAFSNKNKALIDGFFELADSLGLKPNLFAKDAYHGRVWEVSFQAYQAVPSFRLKRKMERSKPGARPHPRRYIKSCRPIHPEPMSCIQVDRKDGMYLAGKRMIPTHNSTCGTFGLTIQEILRNPEETIGIFSHTRPIAKAFMRKIKVEFEQNERLKRRHANVLWQDPQNEAPKWNEDEGITVKRRGNPNEQTIEAWGIVDGQPISKHFGIRVGDDLVTRDSVNTPEMMLKTEEYWALSLNLGKAGGQERYFGTRYHFSDLYALMRDRGHLRVSVHPAREPATPNGKSVFLPQEYLDKQTTSMGTYVSASQYLLNPVADESQGFRREWRQTYAADPSEERKGKNIYILVDPAGAKSSRSDYTSMWVIGLGSDQNYYVLDGLRDRLNLSERADRLFELHALYNGRSRSVMEVRYEEYALIGDMEHIAYLQERRNYRFHMTPVRGAVNKQTRIRRLVPIFQEKRIYFPENGIVKRDTTGKTYDLCKVFFDEEFLAFPVGSHDDMLDALSRIAEPDLPLLWPQPGFSPRDKGYDPYDAPDRRSGSQVSWMGG